MPKVVTINGVPTEVLTRAEAAKRLGVGTHSIWKWAMVGVGGMRLGSVLVGGSRYYLPALLDAFIQLTPNAMLQTATAAPVEQPRTPEATKAELRRQGYKV